MTPPKRPERYNATLKEIIRGKEIQRLRFDCDRALDFTAGQFLVITLPSGEKRSYSIASAPGLDSGLELLIGNVVIGEGTKYLCSLKEGDTLEFLAPFGLLHFLDQEQEETIFIATATGLAPFRSMYLEQLQKGFQRPLILLYGNRYNENLIYNDELKKLSRDYPSFTCTNILSKPSTSWTGRRGHVTDLLPEIDWADGKKRLFYICGGQKMIEDVRVFLSEKGIPREQIRVESFG